MTVSARGLALAITVLLIAGPAFAAGDRYALVVSGASGGDAYAEKYDAWRQSFVKTLREKFAYPDDHIVVLAEKADAASGVGQATRQSVERALADFRTRVTREDTLLVFLIGHGTTDGDDGKFNLVGPDLTATQWSELVKPIAGRVVFIDTTSASFPFLHKLAGPGHVVLTATDASAQQFETIFPEFFVKAFDDPAADADKNGRVSLWEAFAYASAGVSDWYQQHGQLATERPVLDDNGDGVGREAQNPGADGTLARVTYLERELPQVVAGNTALTALLKRKADLEAQVDLLKARKDSLPPEEYEAALERVLVELARVSAEIRTKS